MLIPVVVPCILKINGSAFVEFVTSEKSAFAAGTNVKYPVGIVTNPNGVDSVTKVKEVPDMALRSIAVVVHVKILPNCLNAKIWILESVLKLPIYRNAVVLDGAFAAEADVSK